MAVSSRSESDLAAAAERSRCGHPHASKLPLLDSIASLKSHKSVKRCPPFKSTMLYWPTFALPVFRGCERASWLWWATSGGQARSQR